MTKKKKLILDCCADCSHRYEMGTNNFIDIGGMSITGYILVCLALNEKQFTESDKRKTFPDFCPLEDVKE